MAHQANGAAEMSIDIPTTSSGTAKRTADDEEHKVNGNGTDSNKKKKQVRVWCDGKGPRAIPSLRR